MLHSVTIQKLIDDGDICLGCSLVIVGTGATGQRQTLTMVLRLALVSRISLLSGRVLINWSSVTAFTSLK